MSLDPNAGSFTAAQLLSDIRQHAQLPATATDWPDATVLRVASQTIHNYGSWALSKSGNSRMVEMFHRSVAAALGSAYRAGSDFELPPLAIGDTIENVTWIDSAGTREKPLQLVDGPGQWLYDRPDSQGDPAGYSLAGGRIRVYPQPNSGGIIRFNYPRRHPDLIADSSSLVATVASVANSVTEGYSAWTLAGPVPFATGDFVDVINGQFPYRVLFSMVYVGSAAGTDCSLYLPYGYVSSLPVNDMRIVKSGQSPYVHLPVEMLDPVAYKAASKIQQDIGDLTGAAASDKRANDTMGQVLQMLTPQAKSDREKFISPHSALRSRVRTRRR